MLTSLNRMIGMPVVWQDKQMGSVEMAVMDMACGRLDGVRVRKGIGMARWAASDDIAMIGRRCVVLKRKPTQMPRKRSGEMRRVFLTTGECAGEVTDVLIHGDTLCVSALEVCQGPIERLMGKRSYAAQFHPSQNGEAGEVVVPTLLSWAQLTHRLREEDNA